MGYKVEDKLHLGVRGQETLNITGLTASLDRHYQAGKIG
jgi:hypothetical protein